jgi:hypothetical protein
MSAVLSSHGTSMFAQPPSRAVSAAAEKIHDCFTLARDAYLRDSAAFATRYGELISTFEEAVQEALVENWDGHGARPVSPLAAQMAAAFIKLLPTAFPLPEFSVDPDGEVSLDWIRERDWLLSVSIGADGTIAYAGRFGVARQSGSEVFIDELPPNLLNCLRRLYAP